MKKYSSAFIILLFLYAVELPAQETVHSNHSTAARQIVNVFRNPGPEGIRPFEHWYHHKPWFIGCKAHGQFGLVTIHFPALCIYLDSNNEHVRSQTFTSLFADDQSIKRAADHFIASRKGKLLIWKHFRHDFSHFESLCLVHKTKETELCLVASDALTRWEKTWGIAGLIVALLIIICPTMGAYYM